MSAAAETFRTVAPEVKPLPQMDMPQPERRTLPGGTVMFIHRDSAQPVNCLTVLTRGGRAEMADPAAAMIYPRMLTQGSVGLDYEQMAEVFDFNGSWVRNSLSSHYSVSQVYSINSRFGSILPAFVEMVTAPVFPEEQLSLYRSMCARETEQTRTMVKWMSDHEAALAVMGASHPLALEPTPDEVMNTSRATLCEFFSRFNSPANRTLFLSGDITPEIENLVAEAFFAPQSEAAPSPLAIVPFAGTEPVRRFVEWPGATQNSITATLPAVPRTHPHYVWLKLAVEALGGYFGSRLMKNIREVKGYTYGITASLLGYIDGAYISIGAQADPRYTSLLIDDVRAELRRLADEPPAGDELHRLVQQSASSLYSALESPFAISEFQQGALLSGFPDNYFADRCRSLLEVTPEKIAEMARLYLDPSRLSVAVAGLRPA